MNTSDCMRTVYFRPYRHGMGPTFTLKLFYLGLERIGYRLTMRETFAADSTHHLKGDAHKVSTLFEGSDFRPSPLDSVDGDEAVKAIMTFLTLRPGDTDREYFDAYTPEQLEYCGQYAETLSGEVYSRFGE